MDAKFGTFGIAVNTFSGATSRVARWYIFSNQKKSQIGYILEGLGMENAGIFHDFAAILYILLPFYIFCGHLVSFSSFGMFGPRKIWQPRQFLRPVVYDFYLIQGQRRPGPQPTPTGIDSMEIRLTNSYPGGHKQQ
jgi:hypothetical protein